MTATWIDDVLALARAPRMLAGIRGRARPRREELARFRDRELRRIVRQAYERVPYYRTLFDAHGLSPREVHGLADLARIPITRRRTLQALPAREILRRGIAPGDLDAVSTAGSSGRPLTIRRKWIERRTLAALRIRAMRAYGLAASDVVAIVKTGANAHEAGSRWIERAARALRADAWRVVDCALPIDDVARELRSVAPQVVAGYPSHLARVAEVVGPRGFASLGVKLVCTGGETLADDQRSWIGEAFAAPVRDTYASQEFDLLAWECPDRGGYHVCDDGVVLEILRDGCPVEEGEEGEVVATSLHAHAMPFLRYALGDLVRRGPTRCPCGLEWSTISSIRGRTLDLFELPDGRTIHPYDVFIPARARAPWMRHYRVVQVTRAHVVMEAVADSPPGEDGVALVRRIVGEKLGPAVRFDLRLVDEIAADTGGKFRTYRSLVRRASARSGD